MTMKTTLTVIAMAAAWLVPQAIGQTPNPNPTSKPAAPSGATNLTGSGYGNIMRAGSGHIRGAGYWNITEEGYGTSEDLIKVCDLTADQKRQLLDIEAAKTKVRNDNDPREATKVYRDDLNKGLASGDNDARAKAIAKYAAARKTITEAYAKAQAKIDEANTKARHQIDILLTPEQKAKWKEYTILKDVKQLQQDYQIAFSDQQWDKIMEAYEKLAKDPEIKFSELVMKLAAKIEGILTPEQKAKRLLANPRYAMMNKTVHFTDEQVNKLVKIEDERDKEIAEVRAKDDGTTYNGSAKNYDDQVQAILTGQQKTAWQEVVKKIQEESIRAKDRGDSPYNQNLPPGAQLE